MSAITNHSDLKKKTKNKEALQVLFKSWTYWRNGAHYTAWSTKAWVMGSLFSLDVSHCVHFTCTATNLSLFTAICFVCCHSHLISYYVVMTTVWCRPSWTITTTLYTTVWQVRQATTAAANIILMFISVLCRTEHYTSIKGSSSWSGLLTCYCLLLIIITTNQPLDKWTDTTLTHQRF